MATVSTHPVSVKLPAASQNGSSKKPPAPTESEIKQYLTLSERRSDLEREAREIKKKESELAEKIESFVLASGKDSLVRCGFRCSIVDGNKYPSWKQHFIDRLGVEASIEVMENTPRSKQLQIVKA